MSEVSQNAFPRWRWLLTATGVTALVYVAIASLGPQYRLDVPGVARPILLVLGLYLIAFVPYALMLWLAKTTPDCRKVVWWLVLSSAAFRAILLPTPPFQEIDIYRYLWDGIVTTQGESPYRYPPQTVVEAIDSPIGGSQTDAADPRLAELTKLARDNPQYEDVLREIHYGQYPSPYPPVSQAVFALAAWTTPDAWSAEGRLTMLKVWLTAFDLATLLLVMRLLRLAQQPMALALAYGWCPLLLKEVAGSGHLDSIATFFLTAGIVATAEAIANPTARPVRFTTFSAVLIGLGIGAKLFPMIVAPLLLLTWWRRLGWRITAIGVCLLGIVTAATMAPMLLSDTASKATPAATLSEQNEATFELSPPPGAVAVGTEETQAVTEPTAGLTVFLKQWEMNDWAFMLLLENVRSQAVLPADQRPWFAVVPDAFAVEVSQRWQSLLAAAGLTTPDARQAAFLLTRLITASLFLVIALVLAIQASHPDATLTDWANGVFLTVAWFWLLAPTQNPWYWCWALPFLPFARNRAWFGLAAVSFAYYLRFWLSYHFSDVNVAGTPYDGGNFFHYVVVWLEFFPWMLWLLAEWLWNRSTVRRFTEPAYGPPDNQN